MNDERVILSERPEDLRKAVEWGREQQRKILNEKMSNLQWSKKGYSSRC